MKYLLIAFLFVPIFSMGQMSHFNAGSIKSIIDNDKPTIIYLNALWCSPCIGKEPYVIDYYNKRKDSLDLIIIYDIDPENKVLKHSREINVTGTAIIDPVFYSKPKAIQIKINSSNKAIDKLKKELQKAYPATNWKDLWYGGVILIKDNTVRFVSIDQKAKSDSDLAKLFN